MTAQPTSFDFTTSAEAGTPVLVRPHVVERYWGYDISKNEMEFDLAVLARCAAVLTMIGVFVASIGIWLMPVVFFAGALPLAKLFLSASLMIIGGLLFRFVARSTRVRVQIDTANGEVREVVAGPFGSDVTLAHYGFDAVETVGVAASKLDPNVGQLHIKLKGGLIVPAGDGNLIALRHLRDRVALDCGLKGRSGAVGAI